MKIERRVTSSNGAHYWVTEEKDMEEEPNFDLIDKAVITKALELAVDFLISYGCPKGRERACQNEGLNTIPCNLCWLTELLWSALAEKKGL